jgi:hypothetical protein
MAPKILRRCTICKHYHASYLVEDSEFGKCYLCFSCWKSRQEKAESLSNKLNPESKGKVTLSA